MENDYFQNRNSKHNQNIIDLNQELILQKNDKIYVNNPYYKKIILIFFRIVNDRKYKFNLTYEVFIYDV